MTSKARTLAGTVSTGAVLADGTIGYAEVSGAPTAPTGTVVGTTDSQTLTNKTINGSNNTITDVSLTAGVTGTLPVANGGTGQTTATAAFNALAPSQTSNTGKYLTTNGTDASWAAVSAGFTLGTPVTVSGTVIEFTGIPDGVKQVIVTFIGVGIGSPADSIQIRLGTAEPAFPFDYSTHAVGLLSDISLQFYNSGFVLLVETVNQQTNGQYIFNLQDSTNNHWVGTGISTTASTRASLSSGRLFLPSRLGAVQIRTRNGSALAFGTVNIAYI